MKWKSLELPSGKEKVRVGVIGVKNLKVEIVCGCVSFTRLRDMMEHTVESVCKRF